jgi:hypothetical protein
MSKEKELGKGGARDFETSALQTSLPVDAARALPDNKH